MKQRQQTLYSANHSLITLEDICWAISFQGQGQTPR